MAGRAKIVVRVAQWFHLHTGEGRSLVTEVRDKIMTPKGEFTIEDKEVRTLSADGRTMIVEVSRTTPRGTLTRKIVVDKRD